MIERLPRVWRNTALLLLGALVLWFCWSIRAVINPLLIGYLCAYILHPAVQKLEDRGFSRRSAVLLIFLGGFVLAAGIGFGTFIQTKKLVQEVVTDEGVREKISTQFEEVRAGLEQRFPGLIPSQEEIPDPAEALVWLREFVASHQDTAQRAGEATVVAAGGAFGLLGDVLGTLVAIGGLFLL